MFYLSWLWEPVRTGIYNPVGSNMSHTIPNKDWFLVVVFFIQKLSKKSMISLWNDRSGSRETKIKMLSFAKSCFFFNHTFSALWHCRNKHLQSPLFSYLFDTIYKKCTYIYIHICKNTITIYKMDQIMEIIFKTLRWKQNGRHFANGIFNSTSLNEIWCIWLKFQQYLFPKVQSIISQMMSWRRTGENILQLSRNISFIMITKNYLNLKRIWLTNIMECSGVA